MDGSAQVHVVLYAAAVFIWVAIAPAVLCPITMAQSQMQPCIPSHLGLLARKLIYRAQCGWECPVGGATVLACPAGCDVGGCGAGGCGGLSHCAVLAQSHPQPQGTRRGAAPHPCACAGAKASSQTQPRCGTADVLLTECMRRQLIVFDVFTLFNAEVLCPSALHWSHMYLMGLSSSSSSSSSSSLHFQLSMCKTMAHVDCCLQRT